MGGLLALLYGAIAYVVFFLTFLYAICFLENLGPGPTIDNGPEAAPSSAFLINVLLLGLFAVQHSVMARPAFKRAWTRIVPKCIERSTYVLFASLALILLYLEWRPLPAPIWTVTDATLGNVLVLISWAGWLIVLLSTFFINHFELFGLQQVFARLRGREIPAPVFRTPLLYRWVRHPIYFGFLLAFWATPFMTAGHLLFAAASTGYILIGIALEERDLISAFGEQYRVYRRRVWMLLPLPNRRGS